MERILQSFKYSSWPPQTSIGWNYISESESEHLNPEITRKIPGNGFYFLELQNSDVDYKISPGLMTSKWNFSSSP